MGRPLVTSCAFAVVLGLGVGACARGDQPTGPDQAFKPKYTASSPSPRSTVKEKEACQLLTANERKSIAGERINIVAPSNQPDQCQWVKSLKVAAPTSITVLTASAQAWVQGLPALIDSAIADGRAEDKYRKRLFAAKKQVANGAKNLSDKDACKLFGLLLEATGGKKGSREVVLFQTLGATPSASAQTCTRGVYTGLVYAQRDLVPSEALQAAVLRVMAYAHERAITRARSE